MQIDAIKNLVLSVLRKYPVGRASVFGSFARNEAMDSSDIDLLIEPSSPITLFDVLRMERELSETLHRKIDVVEFSAIKRSLREKVLKEAVVIL